MSGRLIGAEGEALARKAIDLLSEWGIPLTAQNYEVGITHILGENDTLTSDISAIIDQGQTPQEADLVELHDRHFNKKKLSDEVQKIGGAMSAELATVMRRLEEAGRDTAAYGEALAGASDRIDSETDAETLKAMVSALMDATHTMQRHSATLESRLAETKQEVSQLRTNLEIVREESMTDALTGVANRKRMDDVLNKLAAEADQTGAPLTVAVCDIDHFKRFNDTWGHQTGDQIIRFVASCMTRCIGNRALVARYGGEEFVMLMPETDMDAAVDVAEQVRTMVESKRLLRRCTNEDLGTITISIGVARHDTGAHPHSVIERADNRLYESKRAGRNRVTGETAQSSSSAAA